MVGGSRGVVGGSWGVVGGSWGVVAGGWGGKGRIVNVFTDLKGFYIKE